MPKCLCGGKRLAIQRVGVTYSVEVVFRCIVCGSTITREAIRPREAGLTNAELLNLIDPDRDWG